MLAQALLCPPKRRVASTLDAITLKLYEKYQIAIDNI
jgi:hypothetical protein